MSAGVDENDFKLMSVMERPYTVLKPGTWDMGHRTWMLSTSRVR